jgi:hypothetical protein
VSNRTPLSTSSSLFLVAVAAVAVVAGLYARFKGLGSWPLAVDEYYIARSVDNVLRFGVPAYECGGYYTRGFVYQYLTALLRLGGTSAELSARLIAAFSSLIALPAVYLLGRRVEGRTVGLLAIALLALSVWEVEMARFGRMYAPFQAVFVWYLVFFIRYTVDRESRALWAMLALTVLGVATWEGGIFLALVNLLPPFLRDSQGRLTRRDGLYLAGTGLLLIPIAWFVTADLRHAGADPDFPLDYEPTVATVMNDTLAPWTTLPQHPLWIIAALPVLAVCWYALRWLWSIRDRWLVAAGLLGALGAAMLHQFAASATVLLLLLLTGLIRPKELFSRAAVPYHAAIVASAAFWVVFGLATSDWYAHAQTLWLGGNRPLLLLYEFLRFPDFVREIAVPWLRAAPALAVGLTVLLGIAIIHVLRREELSAERAMLAVLVFLVAAAAASDPPRQETRYVFFLYPVALVIAIATITRGVTALAPHWRLAPVAAAVATLVLFGLSGDFRPHHLLNVDSMQANFRLGLPRGQVSHLHPRGDVRGAAQWLGRHALSKDDILINASPGVDYYFPRFAFAYVDQAHQRFEAYACREGTRERWGGLPLLHDVRSLESEIARPGRTVLVIDTRTALTLLPRLERWRPHVAWTSVEGGIKVVVFDDAEPAHARATPAEGSR